MHQNGVGELRASKPAALDEAAGFGALATLLASIGLYGVMAFVVARRTREIGVRLALGAMRGSVVWLVMREVLLLVGLGLAVGIPAALALGRLIAALADDSPPWRQGSIYGERRFYHR